jgi:hypothetical protein
MTAAARHAEMKLRTGTSSSKTPLMASAGVPGNYHTTVMTTKKFKRLVK